MVVNLALKGLREHGLLSELISVSQVPYGSPCSYPNPLRFEFLMTGFYIQYFVFLFVIHFFSSP